MRLNGARMSSAVGENPSSSTTTSARLNARRLLTGWKRAADIQSSTFGEWWMAWNFHASATVENAVNPVEHHVLNQQNHHALQPQRQVSTSMGQVVPPKSSCTPASIISVRPSRRNSGTMNQ